MNKIASILIVLTSLVVFIVAAYLIPSTERPAALLGAGVGLAFVSILAAVLFRRRALIVPVLLFVLMTLTGCLGSGDPLGIVAAEHERTIAQVQTEQIRADAATDQARISASTARVRIGGWLVATTIIGVVAVAVVGIAGMVHIQAQRDRLTHDAWRTQLPAQQPAPPSHRIPDRQTSVGHWMALRRPDSRRPTVLALSERSASHDVIVIDG